MAHNENAELSTHAQKEKAILLLRMIGIVLEPRVVIVKDRLRFLKGYAVFFLVQLGLCRVPDETKLFPNYSINMS